MSAPAPWQAPWQATVLTLFPDMFPGPLGISLAGKALAAETWRLETVDIRAHARDRHRSVDDTPFGGGSGMVMRADVTAAATTSALPVHTAVPTAVLPSAFALHALLRGHAWQLGCFGLQTNAPNSIKA